MTEEEDIRTEERSVEYIRNEKEGLLKDIIRETERDMKATLREVEAKYLRQIAEWHKVERKILEERKEKLRRRY